MVAALHSYTHHTWLRIWGSGALVESTWCHYVMVEPDSHLRLLSAFILDICKVFEHNWYAVHGYIVAALQSYTHPTQLKFWGFLVTCGVKLLSVCHGSDWQPPQTASHIHIRHIQSLSAHWYAVHRYTVAAIQSYPCNLAQIWGIWVTYVELKWCQYIMVEADSHLKLMTISILNVYKVFEHMICCP